MALYSKRGLNLEMERYSGRFLTIEEQLILKTSLPLLQTENKFESVSFWGKVYGTDKDYYIAQGHGKDFIRNKISFYSLDGKLWRFLYLPPLDDVPQFRLVKTMFIGDPAEVHRYLDPAISLDEEDNSAFMSEANRLSTMVTLIDMETSIAPKAAFVLNHNGVVVRNESFHGLQFTEAEKLSSYIHLNLPDCDEAFVKASCPPGPDRASDFLISIDHDAPGGDCWTMETGSCGEVVLLRNLWWPGFTFYHCPGTPEFGHIYMGYGIRNDDLPFML